MDRCNSMARVCALGLRDLWYTGTGSHTCTSVQVPLSQYGKAPAYGGAEPTPWQERPQQSIALWPTVATTGHPQLFPTICAGQPTARPCAAAPRLSLCDVGRARPRQAGRYEAIIPDAGIDCARTQSIFASHGPVEDVPSPPALGVACQAHESRLALRARRRSDVRDPRQPYGSR